MRYVSLFLALGLLMSVAIAEPLILGRVSSNVSKTVEVMTPIGEYVIADWPNSRFDSIEIFVGKDLDSLLTELGEGQVHWVSESVYAASILTNKGGMRPIVANYKKGKKSYGSVLLVDQSIQAFDDLVGKIIAAEDESSFSGYFLVFKQLVELGYPIQVLASVRDTPKSDAINFVFSDDESNNTQWLTFKLVAGSVFSDADYEDETFIDDTLRGQTQVLWASEQFPRAIDLLANSLTREEQDYILNKLMELADQPEHPAMVAYFNSTGFHRLTAFELEQLQSIYQFSTRP